MLKRGDIVPVYNRRRDHTHIYGVKGSGVINVGETGDGVHGIRPTSYQPVSLQKSSVMLRCHFCNTRSGSQISQSRMPHLYVPVQPTESL